MRALTVALRPQAQTVLISVIESASSISRSAPGKKWVRKSVRSPKHSTGRSSSSTSVRSWSICAGVKNWASSEMITSCLPAARYSAMMSCSGVMMRAWAISPMRLRITSAPSRVSTLGLMSQTLMPFSS